MSGFYSVENLGNFKTINPNILLQQNLRYIKHGFNQEQEVHNISATGSLITANQMLSGWIIREQTNPPAFGSVEDISDSAVNIYNTISNFITSECSKSFGILPGFNFDFAIYNEGDAGINFYPGTGVTFGQSPYFTIASEKVGWFRVTVTRVPNSTTLPLIYINELGCCNQNLN